MHRGCKQEIEALREAVKALQNVNSAMLEKLEAAHVAYQELVQTTLSQRFPTGMQQDIFEEITKPAASYEFLTPKMDPNADH